jgi:hypothetical protein
MGGVSGKGHGERKLRGEDVGKYDTYIHIYTPA